MGHLVKFVFMAIAATVFLHIYGMRAFALGQLRCEEINSSWFQFFNSDRIFCTRTSGQMQLGLKVLGLSSSLPVVVLFLLAAATNYLIAVAVLKVIFRVVKRVID